MARRTEPRTDERTRPEHEQQQSGSTGQAVSRKMPFWAVTAIAVAQAWKQPNTVVVEQRKERLPRPGHEGAKQTRSYPPITHWRGMWSIAKDTVGKWSEDKAPQLGA